MLGFCSGKSKFNSFTRTRGSTLHYADVTGITNFTTDNLIVQTFLSNENEVNSRVRYIYQVPWIIDFYIDQGQGRGLGSSDRTLTGASTNTLSNLLHYNRKFNCLLLGMENYGGQLIEIIVLALDELFFIRTGARGKVIRGQR